MWGDGGGGETGLAAPSWVSALSLISGLLPLKAHSFSLLNLC